MPSLTFEFVLDIIPSVTFQSCLNFTGRPIIRFIKSSAFRSRREHIVGGVDPVSIDLLSQSQTQSQLYLYIFSFLSKNHSFDFLLEVFPS